MYVNITCNVSMKMTVCSTFSNKDLFKEQLNYVLLSTTILANRVKLIAVKVKFFEHLNLENRWMLQLYIFLSESIWQL